MVDNDFGRAEKRGWTFWLILIIGFGALIALAIVIYLVQTRVSNNLDQTIMAELSWFGILAVIALTTFGLVIDSRLRYSRSKQRGRKPYAD
jgi:uncharacterized membrane protein YcjF (UPF0283 family)